MKKSEVPTLGAVVRLEETGLIYAVAILRTYANREVKITLVELKAWNARRRANGFAEVVLEDG